jgi:hypothetical protein
MIRLSSLKGTNDWMNSFGIWDDQGEKYHGKRGVGED